MSFLLQSDVHALTHKHLQSRSYATKPGKPKAHTGRVTASKRKPAAATSDAAAGTPKKASARKSASTKKPAAKKRGAAEKPKRKTTSKAKAKGRPKRKVLTEKQKTTKQKDAVRQKTKNLKQQALLDPPKRLPATAYTVLSVETSHKGMKIKEHSKAVSEQYKSLSAEEMEVSSYSPFIMLIR